MAKNDSKRGFLSGVFEGFVLAGLFFIVGAILTFITVLTVVLITLWDLEGDSPMTGGSLFINRPFLTLTALTAISAAFVWQRQRFSASVELLRLSERMHYGKSAASLGVGFGLLIVSKIWNDRPTSTGVDWSWWSGVYLEVGGAFLTAGIVMFLGGVGASLGIFRP